MVEGGHLPEDPEPVKPPNALKPAKITNYNTSCVDVSASRFSSDKAVHTNRRKVLY